MENAQTFTYVGNGILTFSISDANYTVMPGERVTVPIDNDYIRGLIGLGYLVAPTFSVSADKPEAGEHKPPVELAPDATDPLPGSPIRRR